ncbi:uncharacterized protein LOC102399225 isoform X2 [Bubalus bubalis]|uniref:uncharacterized protein LOC102399225 isoform X2 n=1 Tax=Bubalus bubalis TaxID=89462 RepID=UPI000DBC7712|nr:uncharacterized protein LOC102399225 isoform X2 [Bubalus bubalis]
MPADTKAGPQPPRRIAGSSHRHLAPWRRAHRSLQRGFRPVRTVSPRASQCGVAAFPEKVPRSEASTFSASHHVAYFEASAKLRLNVDEAFEQLVRAVRKPRCDRKSWWAGGRRGISASTGGEALSFGTCKPGKVPMCRKVKKCTVTDLGAYQAHRSQFQRSPTAKSGFHM